MLPLQTIDIRHGTTKPVQSNLVKPFGVPKPKPHHHNRRQSPDSKNPNTKKISIVPKRKDETKWLQQELNPKLCLSQQQGH